MKKRIQVISLFVIILLIMTFLILRVINKGIVYSKNKDYELKDYELLSSSDYKDMIFVCIKGEVNSPGIYEIEKGSLLNDIVLMAGGLTEHAGGDINLVYVLNENVTIYIRTKSEAGGMDISKDSDILIQSEQEKVLFENKVNINISDIVTLCLLPGIGEKTAQEIIRYRELNGNFESIEDIMNVPGIKNAKFEKIKDYITIGN